MKENFEKNYIQIPEEPEEEKPKYGHEIDNLLTKIEEKREKPVFSDNEIVSMILEIKKKHPSVNEKIGNVDVLNNSKLNEITE